MDRSRTFQWGVVAVLAIAGGLLVAAGTMQVMHAQAVAEHEEEEDSPTAGPPVATVSPGRTRGPSRSVRPAEEADGVYQRSRIRTDVVAKAAVMSVQTPSDRNYAFSYSYRTTATSRVDAMYSRLSRLGADEALQKAANLSPEQIAKIKEVPTGLPFPAEAKPKLEELFRQFIDAGDGAKREKVKGELLGELAAASDKMVAEAATRVRAISGVLTTEQLAAVRSSRGMTVGRTTPRGTGGGVVAPPTGGGVDLP